MRRARRIVRLITAIVALWPLVSSASIGESLWELTPYRVVVIVALSPTAQQCGDLQAGLLAALPARASSTIGGALDVRRRPRSPCLARNDAL